MKNISRESPFTNSFTILFTFFLNRGACFTFLIVPALFFSCIKIKSDADDGSKGQVETIVKTTIDSLDNIEVLDAFIFEPSGKLDCYQRITSPGSLCEIASGSGPKQILLVANSKYEKYDWTKIRNFSTLSDIYVELEDERYGLPVMTSLLDINAGEQMSVNLLPLRSEVRLNTLKCDFSDEVYCNELLTEVKIYLTNVNANCCIIADEHSNSSRFINTGMLDPRHLSQFTEQDMIAQILDINIGSTTTQIQRSLYCYANQPIEESIGSPMTKLIIEGKIGGDTYYYPIRINPKGRGIARGCRYGFDIILTRAGVKDPDGDLNEKDIEIIMEVEKWEEKDGYSVMF